MSGAGRVVGAGLISHAPTIMLPEDERRALNEGKEISLVPGLKRLRTEVLDRLQPETLVIFDTHWFSTVEHLVSSHRHRAGNYTSDELPRSMSRIAYDYDGDPELAQRTVELAAKFGTRAHATDDPYLPVHYPTINLLSYLHRGERVVSMGCVQTGEPEDFLRLGGALGAAIAELGRRVVLLASGGMSHRFWPLTQLEHHESSDPIHIRSVEARRADEQRLEWMRSGDHRSVIDTMDAYAAHAPEGRFGHYLMMMAAIGGRDCRATGELFSDYENATGTGQVHVWFDKPNGDWTKSGTGVGLS